MEEHVSDNLYIKTIIESNNPFFIGRIAGCELKVVYNIIFDDNTTMKKDMYDLENNAGIKIKNTESLTKYTNSLIQAYKECTHIAEWNVNERIILSLGQGQRYISTITENIPKISAIALEPYYFKENWQPALKGKKILIIHPFSKTLSKQAANLKNIFPNQSWFEDCTLQFLSPPVTLAGNHQDKDWQEHYSKFIESLNALSEFDIALVAAGGYGMLICEHIFKEMKKSVMYIGGALQLFFGVIGKRWFQNKEIMKLVNDDWVRPNKEDKPANFTNVERGCYW
jgi:hypothetical protein